MSRCRSGVRVFLHVHFVDRIPDSPYWWCCLPLWLHCQLEGLCHSYCFSGNGYQSPRYRWSDFPQSSCV